MNEGRCPTCNREMEWDENSCTYFCEHCSRIYDEDEASSSIKWFFETCFMWIPGINILIASLTKDKLKKTIFLNMIMSSIVSMIFISFVLLYFLYSAKGNMYQGIMEGKYRFQKLMMHEYEVEVPEFKPVQLPTIEELVVIEDKPTLDEHMLKYVDGSLISGENVRNIIKDYEKYYLINTFTTREKYGPSIYLPIGKVFAECENPESLEIERYDTSKHTTYTESDLTHEIDDIDNKRTIYYIYPTSYFKVKVIKDKNDKILGLQFTEEVM